MAMYPIMFNVGRFHVYSHGVMMALGAIVGGLVIFYLAKIRNLERHFLLDMLVYSFIGGIVGARLLYVILYFGQFSTWQEVIFVWYGGMVSLGGVLGGLFVAYLFLRENHQNVLAWFDIGIIGLLIGWAIGRVGCFLTGDVVGFASHSWIAIYGQVPVALFESFWSFIVGIVGLILYLKKYYFQNISGLIFFGALGLYCLGRFLIDFYRQENTASILKAGQITNLIIVVISGLIIFYIYRRSKKEQPLSWDYPKGGNYV